MNVGNTIKNRFLENKELILYILCGGATTAVNYVIYFVGVKYLGIDYLIGNTIAWAGSVFFAFLVNKIFVFISKDWELRVIIRQVLQFVSARVFSLVLESLMLWVWVSLLGFDDLVMKIAAGIVVVIVNYAFSKWIIFKKES